MAARAERAADLAASSRDEIRPGDFASETASWSVVGVACLAVGLLVVAMSLWNPIPTAAFWLVVAVGAVALAGWLARHVGAAATAAVLAGGLGAIVVVGSSGVGAVVLAPWSSMVVLAAAAIVGWRFGVVVAVVMSGALLILVNRDVGTSPEVVLSAALLTWAGLFLYWLISRPTRTALDWALHSYHEALERTADARARQAELARLSKSLSEYAYRLEQLNLELARARHTANEARKLKEQFAAAVSHELRTPLNLILGFCEMMVLAPTTAYGQNLPASYRADLEAMYRNALHISSLVDDILDLSQIDAGRMALHREWTGLHDVVAEAVATVETLFNNRQLTLRNGVPTDLSPLFLDRTRVRQILINVLSNAARFVQRGGVALRAERQGDAVVVAVCDSGPGIPPEQLPYVFEQFRQAEVVSAGHVGSGLGLAVSKRFAEMHGGTMGVESIVGEGSTFFLKLPLAPAAEPSVYHASDWDDRLVRRVRGRAVRRLVVFDDGGEVRRIFQRHLDQYQVVDGRSFAEALAHGRETPVHGVVLGAPNGAGRWSRLVARAPELARIPVISCPFRTTQRTAEQLGAHQCLVKPIGREQLRAALRGLGRPVRRAVVVDDSLEMTRLLSRMIRSISHGVVVAAAQDGADALELVRRERPDVLLLDLLMPGTDGYAVLDEMAGDPELRDTPVILVTARGTHSEAIVADRLAVERAEGLSVGEVMLWIRTGLDALLGPPDSDPAPAAVRSG